MEKKLFTIKKNKWKRLIYYRIYYLDESWIKVGNTKNTIWKDLIVTLARIAYSNGLSTGLKNSFENRKDNYSIRFFARICIFKTKKKKNTNYYEKNASKFEELVSKMNEKIEEHLIS